MYVLFKAAFGLLDFGLALTVSFLDLFAGCFGSSSSGSSSMMRQYSENCLSLSISARMKPLLIICSGTAPQSKNRTAGINKTNMDQGNFWITVSSRAISFTTAHYFGQFLLEILHLMNGSHHTLYLQPIPLEFGEDFARNMPKRS